MLRTALDASLILVALAILLGLYRLALGPTVADRVVAADATTSYIIAAVVLFSLRQKTAAYMDTVLVLAALSFIPTMVAAKFMVKGVLIDRDDG